MVKKLSILVIMALTFMGCNEKPSEPVSASSPDNVRLTVMIPQNVTKVTGTYADANVNEIQVFVFDRYGVYETSSNGSGASLSLTCTSGEKQIVALVNAPLQTGVQSITQLRSKVTQLSDCSSEGIVMYGEATETLTASSSINMPVERVAARIAIAAINLDFEQEQHRTLPFEVKSIYLINVAGDRNYQGTSTPSVWYNKTRYIAQTSLEFLYDEVTDGSINHGSSYTKEHFFYCYPNSTETKTRLVVETEIGGYTYYYPLTLESVEGNTAYTYDLTITRLGSDSPDDPVEDGTVKFTVVVKDWVEQNVNETI